MESGSAQITKKVLQNIMHLYIKNQVNWKINDWVSPLEKMSINGQKSFFFWISLKILKVEYQTKNKNVKGLI